MSDLPKIPDIGIMNIIRPIRTIEDLEQRVGEILIMADKGVIRLICYTAIANAMRLGPVWSCIVAPPSGGKSELLQSLFDMSNFIYPLSSLTPNTFISGAQNSSKSTSLLDEIEGKTVVMKDLTTIVEMSKEDQRSILAQMREIYDKRFDKAFGTGMRKNWEGHVGWLGAITPEGAEALASRGAMGERFIFYRMVQPDRMAVLYKSADNQAKNMELQQLKLRAAFNEYLEPRLIAAKNISEDERKVLLDPDTLRKIFVMADFATKARSNVRLHWKTGDIEYVYPPEMPTRFANQLIGLTGAMFFDYKYSNQTITGIKKLDLSMLTDIAWGSIPPHRSDLCKILAKYKSATTKAVAAEMRYESGITRPWLAELAGLKIIRRDGSQGGGDVWRMDEEYRDVVCEYEGIKKLDIALSDHEVEEYEAEPGDVDVEAAVLAAQSNKIETQSMLGDGESNWVGMSSDQAAEQEERLKNDPDDY